MIVESQDCRPKNNLVDLGALSAACTAKVSPDANKVAQDLKSRGFQCSDPSDLRGIRCRGKFTSYNQAVNIFIPPQYSAQKKTDWNWHFHGFLSSANADPFDLKTGAGDFGQLLKSAGSNDIVVAPESRGKCEDYRNVTAPQFVKMLQEGRELLKSSGATLSQNSKLGLSGHSGAYVILNKIGNWNLQDPAVQVELSPLARIALLDSVYASQDSGRTGIAALIEGVRKKPGHNIVIAYNPSGSNKSGNQFLEQKSGFAIGSREPELTQKNDLGKIVFIRDAKTAHGDFVSRYYRQFLD